VDDKTSSEIFLWNGSYYHYEVVKLNEVLLEREQRSVIFFLRRRKIRTRLNKHADLDVY